MRNFLAAAMIFGWSTTFALHSSADTRALGDTLVISVGTAVGGSFDAVGRVVARHYAKHLPHKPNVVVQNMPGAGGLIATNHLFNNAPQDGTFMSVIVPGVLFNQLFKEKGVRFDGTKLHWVGNPIAATAVSTVFHTAPVKTWRDALSMTVLIGATGPTGPDAMVANLANSILGTKLKVIAGYKGGQNISLAMETGEVHGRGTQTWAGWKATNPDWVATGKLTPLWQIGRKADPELPDVPLLHEIVSGADDRAIVLVYANVNSLGRPFAMGPKTPPKTVQIFRRGFDSLMHDEAFRKDALKISLELGPMSGEEIQEMVGEVLSLDDNLASRLKDAIRN